MQNFFKEIPIGVLTASESKKIFKLAKKHNFAIPAINVVNTISINSVLETAKKNAFPIIIQLSYGGAKNFIGQGLEDNVENSTFGAILAAEYIHKASIIYKVSVILHTDHANRKLLPWIDLLLIESISYFKKNSKPLFTSHMIDLSEEALEKNISTCKEYLEKMYKINMFLEIELGVTGGEEDGVDNTDIDNKLLYSQPEDIAYAYKELMQISDNFIIAASFGNVHGVYKSGNVILTPSILDNSQKYIQKKYNTAPNPIDFVFHGGSGSKLKEIQEAIKYGVIKMNLDTDIQWAFFEGVKKYINNKKDFLNSQIGNPEGIDKPNKKYYDPRKWLRYGELSIIERVSQSFKDLKSDY